MQKDHRHEGSVTTTQSVSTHRPRFGGRLTQWLIFLAVALTAYPLVAQAEDPLLRVRIEHPQPAQLASELEGAGYDVMEGSVTASSLEVVVSGDELEELRASGLEVIEIESGRPLREILPIQDGSDALPSGYLDLDGINDRMAAIAAAFPDMTQMVDLTEAYGVPATDEGRHLFALVISDNVGVEEDEPAMMIVSNHHAREIVTPVIALDAMDRLTQGYGTDPRITDVVDNNEIWIAPTWNPDGYNHVVVGDNLWRKNRRVFAGGIGVDQNRNYPQGWNSGCAGSTSPSSNTYKGPSPASEAETQTMIAWSQDRRFAKVIDYHSRGREVLYGYDCSQHPFAAWLQGRAAELSSASGYGGATRAPSADGEHYQWQLAQMGAWSHLIETATQFQPSFNSARQESDRVWPGVLFALERPISLSGHVTDAQTGSPLEADIELLGVNFQNGESNGAGGPFGRYHVFARPDTYDVQFSAAGYQTVVQTVTIDSDTSAVELDVHLQPEISLPAVSISASDATATEAGLTTGTFSIRRTGDTSTPLVIRYTVGGNATAGNDYLVLSGSVTIAAGSNTADVNVVPIDDTEVEPDEVVILSLSNGAGYQVGTPGTTTVAIVSDDVAPPGGTTKTWMSFRSNTAVPGVGTVRDEDIVSYDETTGEWTFEFDGSDVGLAGFEIDGLAFHSSGDLLLSFTRAGTIGGISVDDSDIVRFTPTALGRSTAGTFSMYFDGSDVGLTRGAEDVDAIAVAADGRLIISTSGSHNVNGISGADEDLIIFTGTLGPSTSGSFARYVDGSDVGLNNSGGEDVDAAGMTAGGDLLFSTLGNFSVTGLTGRDEDIVEFSGSFGPATSGSFSMRQDLSALGISGSEDIGSLEFVDR